MIKETLAAAKVRVNKIEEFLMNSDNYGMNAVYSKEWPVLIRRTFYEEKAAYAYYYPYAFFDNIQRQCPARISYDKKSERRLFLTMLIDNLMNEKIDIFHFHLGLYFLFPNFSHKSYMEEEEISEDFIGKKRFNFFQTLPLSKFLSNDDFISSVWASLIENYDFGGFDVQRSPAMNEVRILFSSQQFSDYTGTFYSDVDWVEPLSHSKNIEVKKYGGF